MRVTFLGAARMVTGSCYLVEAGGLRLLVDCGMFQGGEEELNSQPFGFDPALLDGVILTHAHIDHSGRLPLLVKQGYRGPIYTHPASADLAAIMLQDSAHIQEAEVERLNRKGSRAGLPLRQPLYNQADALRAAELFRPIPYGQMVDIGSRVQIRLQDAGHILGSAMLELFEQDEAGRRTKLLFSGDVGQPGRPILQDPTPIDEADYLVLESTYGNKLHDPPESKREQLATIIRSTIKAGGNVIIPAFAVGRAQEILYELNGLVEAGQLPRDLRVVLDSPLAISATEITTRHADVYDDEARRLLKAGDQPFNFRGLEFSRTGEDSKALNFVKKPMVIIAPSGMCEAGRVVHHLKHNLWRENCTVLFVGFQAQGSLGRRIMDGAKVVKIHGEEIAVRCRIETMHGFSAHADQAQLLAWVDQLKQPPQMTFLVHGEAEAQAELSRLLTERGHRVEVPQLGQSMALRSTSWPRRQPKAEQPAKAKLALAEGAALALSSRRMTAVLREMRDLRKAWLSKGQDLPPDRAAELADRAGEVLRALEQIRRVMGD